MPIPVLVPFALLGLAALRGRRTGTHRAGERNVKSAREDYMDSDSDGQGGEAAILDQAIGKPYSYGGGSPRNPLSGPLPTGRGGGKGWDCSGFAQAALVALGILDAGAPDRGSAALSAMGADVPWGQQRAGDLAFYGSPVSHVMVVRTEADPELGGDCTVIGASGGRSSTNGDDPNARIKMFGSAKYRKDFRFFRRL